MPADAGDEVFDLVDESGRVIGRSTRRACHSDPRLIHPVVHVLVFDPAGRLLLQKRSTRKDTQPGKWDTSVGGHLHPGEDPLAAARREMREELGIEVQDLRPSHEYLWRCPRETEYVRTFTAVSAGPFRPDPDEIDEVRFWSAADITDHLGQPGPFTPNFEEEWHRIKRGSR